MLAAAPLHSGAGAAAALPPCADATTYGRRTSSYDATLHADALSVPVPSLLANAAATSAAGRRYFGPLAVVLVVAVDVALIMAMAVKVNYF